MGLLSREIAGVTVIQPATCYCMASEQGMALSHLKLGVGGAKEGYSLVILENYMTCKF